MNLAYRTYLNSPHWKQLRQRKNKKRCAICGEEGPTDRHHLRYRHLYDVEKSDLRNICRRCHETFHSLNLKFPSEWSNQKVFANTRILVLRALGLPLDTKKKKLKKHQL